MKAKILVVDDHTLVRQGIVKLLSGHELFEVVGEASSGFEAITKAKALEVNAVLMDMYMPGLDGVAATRLLKKELPDVAVIILTATEDENDLFEAIEAGARGYILKSTDSAHLINQVKQVLTGGIGMSEEITQRLVSGISKRSNGRKSNSRPEFEELTNREKEVLALIAKGYTNKEIASELYISENTVRAHVRTLMQKLNQDNRTQLAVYGVHEGYTLTGRGAGTPEGGAARR
jgi:DNA-binding NarL/FixJ family response regulator